MRSAEQRALRLSVAAGATAAVLGVVWGLLSGSRVVLVDGAFGAIGIVMSVLSLLTARAVERGESARYPYGRESLVPLSVAVQGFARLGIIGYAVVDAVLVILDGGDEVAAGSVLLYAVVSLAICLGVVWALPRIAPTSELAAVEVVGWRSASYLSAGVLIGFGVVALLPAGEAQDLAARYADPVLVIVSCCIVLPIPFRLIRGTLTELLEMSPPAALAEPARSRVQEVCARHGLPEPVVRLTKTGAKLYVELHHVVAPGTWDTADVDRLRWDLVKALDSPDYGVWLNVELTTDPAWATR